MPMTVDVVHTRCRLFSCKGNILFLLDKEKGKLFLPTILHLYPHDLLPTNCGKYLLIGFTKAQQTNIVIIKIAASKKGMGIRKPK